MVAPVSAPRVVARAGSWDGRGAVAVLDVGVEGDGGGVSAGPALLPPLRGPRVHIDRVQASEDLHPTLRLVIATLDHHEGAASTDPLRIGVGLVRRDAEVGQRRKQGGSLVGGVPLDGCGVGRMARGVPKREMHITACKTVLDELLHDMLRVCKRLI